MIIVTEIFLYIVGVMSFIFAIKLIKKSNKQNKEIEKYEFDNRSSGGVVQFVDFEASESHNRKKVKMSNIYAAGILLIFVSLIILAVAYLGF